MEMHQVRYFLALCDTLNFTRAAELCHVSQPALTTAIKKLEEELEGALFHRERGRVALTELGRMTQPLMTQMANQAEAVRNVADNHRLMRQVPLNIGVMTTIGPLCLAPLLMEFRRAYPGVEVALHEGSPEALNERLMQDELDIAVMSVLEETPPDLAVDALYRERYVVAFPSNHPFAALDTLRLEDVAGAPYLDRLACEMREIVLSVCETRNVELYATYRSEREDWIQGMILAELGFAFLPEFSISVSGVLTRPLVDPVVERLVSLVSVKGRALSPASEAFRRGAIAHAWPKPPALRPTIQ